jgi:hypothetical protein
MVFFSTCLNAKATIWVFCHLAGVSVLCPSSLATASHLTMQYSFNNGSKRFHCWMLDGLDRKVALILNWLGIQQWNHSETVPVWW